MNRTLNTPTGTEPVDIDAIRDSINHLLGPDAQPPTGDSLATLHHRLRGHMQLLIPEVEQAALQRDKDDVPRYCALACIGEARGKLRAPAPPGGHHALPHARRLARSLAALCDHYEALTEVAMCLACDQPLRKGDATLPYDHVTPSGPATQVGRIHARCAHTIQRP